MLNPMFVEDLLVVNYLRLNRYIKCRNRLITYNKLWLNG